MLEAQNIDVFDQDIWFVCVVSDVDQDLYFVCVVGVGRIGVRDITPTSTTLSINGLQASDAGTYVCVTGPLRYVYKVEPQCK